MLEISISSHNLNWTQKNLESSFYPREGWRHFHVGSRLWQNFVTLNCTIFCPSISVLFSCDLLSLLSICSLLLFLLNVAKSIVIFPSSSPLQKMGSCLINYLQYDFSQDCEDRSYCYFPFTFLPYSLAQLGVVFLTSCSSSTSTTENIEKTNLKRNYSHVTVFGVVRSINIFHLAY